MILSFKDISKVKFPVYVLPSSNWQETDGLLFLDGHIVDDKNMPGATLGIRRLQTPHKGLLRLKHQIDNLRGLLKNDKNTFIDTSGTPFVYEKTQFCKLKYYRIKSITPRETCSLLRLWGVKQPFAVPRPPALEMQYAGILHYGSMPWILYEYSEEPHKDTRRKV